MVITIYSSKLMNDHLVVWPDGYSTVFADDYDPNINNQVVVYIGY